MLKARPEKAVKYLPYLAIEGIRQKPVLKGWEIDFSRLYPDAETGQLIFIKAHILAEKRDMALLNLRGGRVRVFYDGKEILPEEEDDRGRCYAIEVSSLMRELTLECCMEKGAILEIVISTVYYRGMDAKDYLNHIRMLRPYRGIEMEGLSAAGPYPEGTKREEVFWEMPDTFPGMQSVSEVDFRKWYGQEKGKVAYAVSRSKKDGRIAILPNSECGVQINGRVIQNQTQLESRNAFRESCREICLQEGDMLLIKSFRDENGWGFCCNDKDDVLELPVVDRTAGLPDKFLLAGAFGINENRNHIFGPEREIQWNVPYFKDNGERCFWRFNRENMYLRAYMHTSFFGQWFYALMVGNYGLLYASEFLGRAELTDYFLKNMRILSDYYEYAKYDAALFGESAFLQRSVVPDNLDAIGAAGMCLAESYKRTLNGRTLSVLLDLASALRESVPRFEDGSFHRKDTMWADDIFMSVPFLLRMWEITEKEEFVTDCFCQFRGARKRLYMDEKGVFSHIYFLENQQANKIPWGRGNGWIFLAMSDFLKKLLERKEKGRFKAEIRETVRIYKEFAAGVARYQDEEGMWHQVMDEKYSYQETSCTGMFVAGMSYGVACGVLDSGYIRYARKGMEALRKKAITGDGIVRGVCRGSECSMERSYYRRLGTVDDDDHGTGIILLAMTALQEAEKKLEKIG